MASGNGKVKTVKIKQNTLAFSFEIYMQQINETARWKGIFFPKANGLKSCAAAKNELLNSPSVADNLR